MKNFRTFDLAKAFYHECKALPLKGAPKNQLNRASLSIGLNLAEGRGKHTKKEQLRFFHIAMGSLRESQALLDIENLHQSRAYILADLLGAHLYKLIQNAK